MAVYTVQSLFIYNSLTGEVLNVHPTASGTLTEPASTENGIADIGEDWIENIFDYVGTFELAGTKLPVNQNTSDPDLYVVYLPTPGAGGLSTGDFVDVNAFTAETLLICFLTGTAIATPDGSKPVEDLTVGDAVLTSGGATTVVKWVGQQKVSTLFGAPERLMPVRVREGALGDGLPSRDLTLTADHALLIDGLLINAGALVNGTSIDWVPLEEFGDSFTVYHVETENHDMILAEGTPAETFIDYAGRQAFDNYAEYVDLYGDDRTIVEMPLPRISAARLVPQAIKARLGLCGQVQGLDAVLQA
ncbi:Hint domain-containing protein [Roseovarius confluentis]|uniref:Hint domain-containing protein n=1 Tax=Roseovarius confluentis TaxID=1852027 RepID=UPI000CDD8000|nr:Hint domain-containing protein [Roseovarius confluentis]